MQQSYSAKQFSNSLFSLDGISKKTIEEHLKLYEGYVKKYNEINQALSALTEEDYLKANQVYSHIRGLKVELSFAWSGITNHELYFSILENEKGTTGSNPSGTFATQVNRDFESFDKYKMDMKATGISARGWVWTCWNSVEKRLINYLGDSQNTYLTWYTIPLVALDTYEHAYFIDQGTNRGAYIDAFFKNINWDLVEQNFSSVTQ